MLSKVPITETFFEVKNLVYLLVMGFYNTYKFDYDLCVAEGFYGFLQAYDTYNPNEGSFTTWVHLKISRRLNDLLRIRIKEAKRFISLSEKHDKPKEVIDKFNPEEWLQSLSRDARKVARLVLDKPIEIRWYLAKFGLISSGNWKQALRMVLRESGWNDHRIKKSFNEIRGKL